MQPAIHPLQQTSALPCVSFSEHLSLRCTEDGHQRQLPHLP
jgi:hypothetical protein